MTGVLFHAETGISLFCTMSRLPLQSIHWALEAFMFYVVVNSRICQCRNYRYVTLCLPSCIHLHSMVIDDLVLCNGITSRMITNCFNRKGCGRKYSQTDLRDYLGSCLEGLRKSIKTLEQDSLSLGWVFNLRCLKYKAGLPTTRPPLSVSHITSAGTPYLNTMLVAVEMSLPPYILMARYSSGRTFHFL